MTTTVCVCSERGKRKKKRSSENPSDTLALARPRQDILCCIPFSFLGASPVRRLFLLFFFILPNWTFYVSFLAASLRCFNLRSGGIIYVSTSIPPPSNKVTDAPIWWSICIHMCDELNASSRCTHTHTQVSLIFPAFLYFISFTSRYSNNSSHAFSFAC